MIFGLFRDKEMERFAADLARQLVTRVPPATMKAQTASSSKLEATLAKAFHHVFMSAENYCRDHRVGLLKRARFSKSFQDELKSLGYPDDFVKEATLGLAKQLTQI